MAKYSAQLDPFFAQLEIAAEAGDYGRSFQSVSYSSNAKFQRALMELAMAEIGQAMLDSPSYSPGRVNTFAKFDGMAVSHNLQKAINRAPYGASTRGGRLGA